MKHISIKSIVAACGIMALAMPAAAQQDALRTGYFLEGYTNRHELNPAFAPERNFFTLPALGGFNNSLNGNVGLNTFLYPMTINGEEQLTTFMNPNVDANEFLNKVKSNTKLQENFTMPILNGGWEAWGGYNTIGISVTAGAGLVFPRDMFEFMKLGQTGDITQYDFGNLGIRGQAYAKIALGHSRQITPQLRVGGKLNFYLGAFNAYGSVDRFDAEMTDDKWTIRANGDIYLAGGSGLKVPTRDNGTIDFDNIDYDSFGLTGFGMGLDLGAVYQLTPALEVSASLLDLGFISWSNVHAGHTNDAYWEFDGFHAIALDKNSENYDNNKLGEQFKNLGDQLQDAIEYRMEQGTKSRTTGIGATLHIGAQYKMPFYQPLRGGFLFTQRINGPLSWTEGRFSANVSPVKWFDAALNYGVSTFGSSLGWMINFHPKGINLFLGCDYQFWKVTPQMVPVGRTNLCASFGINFSFGSKREHKLSPLLADNFKRL